MLSATRYTPSSSFSSSIHETISTHIMRRTLASQANPKKEGDISSVFSSLSGAEFKPLPDRYAALKKRLIQGHEEDVTQSWKRLLRRLAVETKVVAERGNRVVPEIRFEDIGSGRTKEFEEQVKLTGVAVVRGVVPQDEARGYKGLVEEYVRANPSTKAFPAHQPTVFELYWSEAQVLARSHPNLVSAQKYLMSLWHSKDPEAMISTTQPLTYADRVRIRQPGDAGFALGPHVDGGSLERWEEGGYGLGNVYGKIFSGSWEEYDPWESSCRVPAVTDLYAGAGACTMFRMFQGWLSMSETSPFEGTLMVNPLLQLSTAYFLLRPFFTPLKPPSGDVSGEVDEEYLHEDNWVLEQETSSAVHGAGFGVAQELNAILHPHLDLVSTMVHVPKIKPGDFVVWHCDSIHAVDKVHQGKSDSSVLYIPVCPLTESNVDYLVNQRDTFVSGFPPPDFPGGKGESEHRGRPSLQFLEKTLTTESLRAMGFAKFDTELRELGETKMIEKANATLGFA